MAVPHGKTWAKKSAATLARRLRRERASQILQHAATEAAASMPPGHLSEAERDCMRHIMLDFGMAKLDHWALDAHNGMHCHHHGEALDRAAPSLHPDLHQDFCHVKKRGDAARHCAGPALGLGSSPTFLDHEAVHTKLDALGTMVASLQLYLFSHAPIGHDASRSATPGSMQEYTHLDPLAPAFFPSAGTSGRPDGAVRPSACEAGLAPWVLSEPSFTSTPHQCKRDPDAAVSACVPNVITYNAAISACETNDAVRPSASDAGHAPGLCMEPSVPIPPPSSKGDPDATASACAHDVITFNAATSACETDEAVRPSASDAGHDPRVRTEPYVTFPPRFCELVHDTTVSACGQHVFTYNAATSACETDVTVRPSASDAGHELVTLSACEVDAPLCFGDSAHSTAEPITDTISFNAAISACEEEKGWLPTAGTKRWFEERFKTSSE